MAEPVRIGELAGIVAVPDGAATIRTFKTPTALALLALGAADQLAFLDRALGA